MARCVAAHIGFAVRTPARPESRQGRQATMVTCGVLLVLRGVRSRNVSRHAHYASLFPRRYGRRHAHTRRIIRASSGSRPLAFTTSSETVREQVYAKHVVPTNSTHTVFGSTNNTAKQRCRITQTMTSSFLRQPGRTFVLLSHRGPRVATSLPVWPCGG